jgi:hypothetical protein
MRKSDTSHIIAQGLDVPADCRSKLQVREQANVAAKESEPLSVLAKMRATGRAITVCQEFAKNEVCLAAGWEVLSSRFRRTGNTGAEESL